MKQQAKDTLRTNKNYADYWNSADYYSKKHQQAKYFQILEQMI